MFDWIEICNRTVDDIKHLKNSCICSVPDLLQDPLWLALMSLTSKDPVQQLPIIYIGHKKTYAPISKSKNIKAKQITQLSIWDYFCNRLSIFMCKCAHMFYSVAVCGLRRLEWIHLFSWLLFHFLNSFVCFVLLCSPLVLLEQDGWLDSVAGY